jgi:4-aminobutyrate aminotransferase-like enzyme
MLGTYEFSVSSVDVPKVLTTHRRIQTSIPCLGTRETIERLNEVESKSMHGQIPLVWSKAHDYNVYDLADNCWIDFTSTIFAANIGHSSNELVNNLKSQLDSGLIGSYAYPIEIRATYLEELLTFAGSPFEKGFLLSAGTEATEAAIKLMRLQGKRQGKRRGGIIVFDGNWHGRTLGAQQLSNNESQKDWLYARDPDFIYLPFPYPWNTKNSIQLLDSSISALERQDLEQDVCGFMLETFQGWGALFYPKEFVQAVSNIALKNQILLCFDEMQAGFARTGKPFGFMHYDVQPDLICCGKGMGGGLPISGVLGRAEIMDLPSVGNMSSTHSGNPLMCVAGLTVLHEIKKKNLVEVARTSGVVLQSELQNLCNEFPNLLLGTYGNGLIRSLIFKDLVIEGSETRSGSYLASQVVEKCFQRGVLLVHTGRESIKFGPPLTIPEDAIKEAITVLGEVLHEIQ